VFVAKILEGRPWRDTGAKLHSDFALVQYKGWMVWPAAGLIAQTYIPLELRVLWANVVAFGWSTFMIARAKTSKVCR
jgi:peroxisomal membrane protein 2